MHDCRKNKWQNFFSGILCVAILLLFSSITLRAEKKIPRPTSDFFVNDFAGVLDSNVKSEINQKGRRYQADGGPQIVVTTIDSLEGDSLEQYAIRMARDWGIGSKDENNGILILLAVEERSIRIEVGYGLEGVVTDSLSGRFIRAATPELSEDNYSEGILKLYNLVLAELEEPGTYEENNNNGGSSIIFIILIILMIIFGGFMGPRRRRFGGYYGGGYYGGSSGGGGFRGGGGGFGGGGASGRFIRIK